MSSIFFQYGTVTLSGSRKGSRKSQKVKCRKHLGGFPGGAVVENLPANAGDMGSSPGLGRSHMPRSNWAREPQLLSLRVWSLCSATEEATTGFPGGAVVENLPANAGDTGSSPGLGRSHMPQSNWAREPQLLSLRVWSLCSATGEAAIVRGPHTAMKSGPRLLQLEKALIQKRRPNTAKNKINKEL
ncbi:hypothetical protein J1605_003103 [Eschrichtius robustus]|uniref:Uncharacterized protein n=1 Tax=Eschrichtius robustus TaxID=9764 RepID=A0AB34HU65_ESCRO|nr:hypothetical protein J1605_003103 [Eschrichtius robustus]